MQALFDLISRFERPLLIIGGHALTVHGVMRQTVDLDCLIAVENRDAFDNHLRGGGFTQVSATENFARYTHQSDMAPDVDILFVDAPTLEKLLASATPLHRGEVELQVPSLPHLIALKLHAIRNNPAREAGDLGDIVRLLAANPRAVCAEELAAICQRFGPEGIEAKLQLIRNPQ